MHSLTWYKDGLNKDSRAASASSNATDPVIALETSCKIHTWVGHFTLTSQLFSADYTSVKQVSISLLGRPLSDCRPCPTEIRELIDSFVEAYCAIHIEAHRIGIAPSPDNLCTRGRNTMVLGIQAQHDCTKQRISARWPSEGRRFSGPVGVSGSLLGTSSAAATKEPGGFESLTPRNERSPEPATECGEFSGDRIDGNRGTWHRWLGQIRVLTNRAMYMKQPARSRRRRRRQQRAPLDHVKKGTIRAAKLHRIQVRPTPISKKI
jgi:hypothetical protein